MSETQMRELFSKWIEVWHDRRDEVIPECLAPRYTRHGSSIQSSFSAVYTPEEYGRVLAAEREKFRIRFTIQDQAFVGDRIWVRLTLHRTDPETAELRNRAALQVYRVEDGKLAETWVAYQQPGSAWTDDPG